MARSTQNPPSQSPAIWTEPAGAELDELLRAPVERSALLPCGQEWDAVAISPLDRGLAALAILGISPADGHAVFADLDRRELVILVAAGCAHAAVGPSGVRALSTGTWLLTPTAATGTYNAAWLSSRTSGGPDHYPDAAALRAAVVQADEHRGGQHEQRRLEAAVGLR